MGASLKQYLEAIYIDKAFISSKALSFQEGLTDTSIDEGEAKQAMLSKSSEVIVLADHTKLGKVAFYEVCNKQCITKIITDELAPPQQECINSYKEYGTPTILAN